MGSKKSTLITLISVAVVVILAMATIQSTQASIDFWLEKPDTLVKGVNHITVYCENGGGMDGDFYLTITFTNAVFSTQTELPYTKVDDSTVKVKFVLHPDDSNQKTIYFFVNETAEVSIKLSLEKASLIQFLKPNDLFPTQLTYQWNEETQVFNCTKAQ
ncbi:MAG: hypothetical protein WC325_12965 [Candidatus Bathyarchaeia archaeon]|jgi:hypothetical protein